jgi:diguanylate cyclase (GGDEF)-like protein/PAS domain S-box-containing protein
MLPLLAPGSGHARRHSRVAALFFLLLFVISLASGYAIYRHQVAQEEQLTEEALNHIADIQAAAVSSWMLERMADAAVFSSGRFLGETIQSWAARGSPNDETKQQIREQLAAIKSTYNYLTVAIVDSNGKVRISSEGEDFAPDGFALAATRAAAAANRTQISSIHPSGSRKYEGHVIAERTIDIAAPLLDLHARPGKEPSILLLCASADMHLEPLVHSMPLMNTPTEVLLAEIEGERVVTIASSEDAPHFVDGDPLPVASATLADAARIHGSHFPLRTEEGKTALSVARKVAGPPWYLVAMIDQAATQANVNRLAWTVAGAGAGVLSLLGIGVLLWWKARESEFRLQALQARTETELLQERSEQALRESRERLDSIVSSILDIVLSFSVDLTRLHYINQSVEQIHGFPPSAFLHHPQLWFDTIHPEDRERVVLALRQLTPDQPHCDLEYRIIRRDGLLRWLHCRTKLVTGDGGQPLRIDGVVSDITQRKAAEQQVQILAYYDSVTGLPNRRLLNDRLGQAMHMAMRNRKKVALLFMDLDNFKNINDSLGHHVGDMLLRSIAERLLQCVREEDTVSRIGGDEFLIVLPDLDRGSNTVPVAEKILASTAQPFSLQDQQIHTTISIGISVYPDDGREPHELIRHADSALYQAKSHGRDNYQFFTRELNEQITRSSMIERQLRRAIDAGELRLWYQPQIDTKQGTLIGAEALLRWRANGRDFLSPLEFIPVAEERGLIGKIGEWAIREACSQCKRWEREGLQPVPVAVNVSPIQFQQKGFADLVTGILQDLRLDARFLELEITESSIMRRAPQVAELATRLRKVGVGISIDDFGTGYSSLSYLKQIPIDKIKIDRSFISDMLIDVDDDAITCAIIGLAHSLKLRVIAEGVESKAQIDRLRTVGCDEVQGHFYSSAVSAQVFAGFLGDGRRFADAMTPLPA